MRCWNCGKDRVDRLDNPVTLESTFVCGNCGMDQSKKHQESGLSPIKPSTPRYMCRYCGSYDTIADLHPVTMKPTLTCRTCGAKQRTGRLVEESPIIPSEPLTIGRYGDEEKTIEDIAEELVHKVKSRDELIQKQQEEINDYQELLQLLGLKDENYISRRLQVYDPRTRDRIVTLLMKLTDKLPFE